MAFDPEHPRTEDRAFHPEQASLNRITTDLARVESRDDFEFPDDNARETFVRSLEVAKDQIERIREKIG
ncbi:MAG: hypothetical protein WCV71_00695 [Patescibacteria group bacterium]